MRSWWKEGKKVKSRRERERERERESEGEGKRKWREAALTLVLQRQPPNCDGRIGRFLMLNVMPLLFANIDSCRIS